MGIDDFHLNFHWPFSSARIILIFSECSFRDEYGVCFSINTHTHILGICVYIHLYKCIYIHIYTHMYIVYICIYISVCTYTHMHT